MTRVTSAPSSKIYTPPREKGPFEKMCDSIALAFRKIFSPQKVHEDFQREIKAHRANIQAIVNWEEAQIPTVKSVNIAKKPKVEPDRIDEFFEKFFYNIVVSFFESTLIEQVRNIISAGVTEIMNAQDKNVATFLVRKLSKLEIKDDKTKLLINRSLDYFLKDYTADKRKAFIKQTLQQCNVVVIKSTEDLIESLNDTCTIENISNELGEENGSQFVKNLVGILLPKWLTSKGFLSNLNFAIYQNFKTVIDAFLTTGPALSTLGPMDDISKVSPVLKMVAKIGSGFVSQRISHLFKNMSLKDMFDRAVVVAKQHLLAHTSSYEIAGKKKSNEEKEKKYVTLFANAVGCHPNATTILQGKEVPAGDDVVQQFSNALVDFVLDDDTIRQFVEGLSQERDNLLEGISNPFAIALIDSLIKKENAELFTQALINLKPYAKEGLAQAVKDIGFNKIFSKENIYRILYVYLAPTVSEIIQRVMIKKVVFNEVRKLNQTFITDLKNLYEEYCTPTGKYEIHLTSLVSHLTTLYKSKVISKQKASIIVRLPRIVEDSLKEYMDSMKSKGWKSGGVNSTTFEEEITKYFTNDFSDLERKEYGELLMTLIFQLPEQNFMVRLAKRLGIDKLKSLTDIFTSLFLNGVAELRGVDSKNNPLQNVNPNQVFFEMLQPSITPYENPETVRDLFQHIIKPWSETTIRTETEREAQQFAHILYDLIGFSADKTLSEAVEWAVWGLDKQLIFVLNELFKRDDVNNSLFFHALEIVKDQVIAVKKQEEAKKLAPVVE